MIVNIQTLKTEFRRLRYRFRHEYLTLNNIVITVALLVAASWAWGSVSVMQRNFKLQRNLEDKQRQLKLAELQVETLKYEREYYKSTEYQELTAREHLGLGLPGEKLLILPPNSDQASPSDENKLSEQAAGAPPSNFRQWLDFLSGANARRLQ